jgi:hypothetical protein
LREFTKQFSIDIGRSQENLTKTYPRSTFCIKLNPLHRAQQTAM